LEEVKSHQLLILKLLLMLQIGYLAFQFFRATSDGRYFPAHEDEVINYCSARLFSETGSVRAEGCIAEDVSPIGQMNWYGPGYPFIYGTFQSVFGDHPTLFIQLHFVFVLISLAMIFLLPISLESRLLASIALLFTEQFTAYIYTYFPETLHGWMSVVLLLLLVHAYQAEAKAKRNLIIAYTALVLVFTLSRVTIVFWLAAPIGLSLTKKAAIQMTIVFLLGLAITLLYMRYFTAHPYAGDMQKIDELYQFNLIDFVVKTIRATARNTLQLLSGGSVSTYFLLAMMILAALLWWKTKERILLSALLVSALLMLTLMAYYTAYHWYFLKQSAVLVPMLIITVMVSESSRKVKYGVVLLAFLTFPVTHQSISNSILQGKQTFSMMENQHEFQSALMELRNYIGSGDRATVLWCYNEYDFGVLAEALLPFSTTDGEPVLYTSNIVKPDDEPSVRFRLHHKIEVNYVLSRQQVDLPNLELIHSSRFYYFYKLSGQGEK
jgi:hypothetical protein